MSPDSDSLSHQHLFNDLTVRDGDRAVLCAVFDQMTSEFSPSLKKRQKSVIYL